MKANIIINELINRGYNAELTVTNKNGIEKEGIIIKTEGNNICPIIYTSCVENEDILDKAVNKILEIYENHKDCNFDFDVEKLTNPDFAQKSIYVGIQKSQTNPKYISRPTNYEGIDEYLYIRINDEMTTKVTDALAERLGIDINELFNMAYSNTFEIAFLDDFMGMTILSNHIKSLGAAELLNDKLISKFATDHGVDKVYIIPSSIHELILIPYSEDLKIEDLNEMVQQVNAFEVSPEEQLADNVLIWERA